MGGDLEIQPENRLDGAPPGKALGDSGFAPKLSFGDDARRRRAGRFHGGYR
jgi:hypothetical protein